MCVLSTYFKFNNIQRLIVTKGKNEKIRGRTAKQPNVQPNGVTMSLLELLIAAKNGGNPPTTPFEPFCPEKRLI